MYNFVKKGAFMLLVACLAMGMASCSDDDPDYSNVTPPTVAVTHSISGRVTGVDGEGISATVSIPYCLNSWTPGWKLPSIRNGSTGRPFICIGVAIVGWRWNIRRACWRSNSIIRTRNR